MTTSVSDLKLCYCSKRGAGEQYINTRAARVFTPKELLSSQNSKKWNDAAEVSILEMIIYPTQIIPLLKRGCDRWKVAYFSSSGKPVCVDNVVLFIKLA